MAETLNTETVEQDTGSNMLQPGTKEWDDFLSDYFQERMELDAEVAAAIAAHVKPLRDKRNKLNKNARAELNATEEDIKPDYLKFKRYHEIQQFEDIDDRARALTALSAVHHSMRRGGQLNFLSVVGADEANGVDAEDDGQYADD